MQDLQLDPTSLALIALLVPLAVNRIKQWDRVPSWSLPWLCAILGALGDLAYSAMFAPGGVRLADLLTGAVAGAIGLWGRESVDQARKAGRRVTGRRARRRSVDDRDDAAEMYRGGGGL